MSGGSGRGRLLPVLLQRLDPSRYAKMAALPGPGEKDGVAPLLAKELRWVGTAPLLSRRQTDRPASVVLGAGNKRSPAAQMSAERQATSLDSVLYHRTRARYELRRPTHLRHLIARREGEWPQKRGF
jgi:hypothetical protein